MKDKADTYCGKCIKADVCGMEGVYDPATTYCAYRVEAQPHGEWIETYYSIDGVGASRFKCSKCGKEISTYGNPYNFCPNCGASMRKDGEKG